MEGHLPLSVRLSARAAVIIDASLALTPAGLLGTLALAHSAQVWLPRGLYTLLDNDAHYRAHPEAMGGTWLPEPGLPERLAALASELDTWRRAWHNGRLSARVHWLGDAQYESLLPDRAEADLLPRFEYCCAALDRRGGEGAPQRPDGPLDECARDVVALAAALQPEPVCILTLGGEGAAAPPLVRWLEGRRIGARPRGATGRLPAALEPAFSPFAATRTAAAAVEVVAPLAVAIGSAWEEGDWEDLDVPADEPPSDWSSDPWRAATALWQPLDALQAAA